MWSSWRDGGSLAAFVHEVVELYSWPRIAALTRSALPASLLWCFDGSIWHFGWLKSSS